MIDWLEYLTYLLACVAIIIVPGPTVTVIIANSLRSGCHAGLMNVAGTQFGLLLMFLLVGFGLELIITELSAVFDWIRLIGAIYLVWLGIRLWRGSGQLGRSEPAAQRSLFWQGFLVVASNPKVLFFLGAFIPQFINPVADTGWQILVLGASFMVLAAILDSGYALIAGRAGSWLRQGNVRKLELASGGFLVGGGLWLALLRPGA